MKIPQKKSLSRDTSTQSMLARKQEKLQKIILNHNHLKQQLNEDTESMDSVNLEKTGETMKLFLEQTPDQNLQKSRSRVGLLHGKNTTEGIG